MKKLGVIVASIAGIAGLSALGIGLLGSYQGSTSQSLLSKGYCTAFPRRPECNPTNRPVMAFVTQSESISCTTVVKVDQNIAPATMTITVNIRDSKGNEIKAPWYQGIKRNGTSFSIIGTSKTHIIYPKTRLNMGTHIIGSKVTLNDKGFDRRHPEYDIICTTQTIVIGKGEGSCGDGTIQTWNKEICDPNAPKSTKVTQNGDPIDMGCEDGGNIQGGGRCNPLSCKCGGFYSCDSEKGGCIEDPNGKYADVKSCSNECNSGTGFESGSSFGNSCGEAYKKNFYDKSTAKCTDAKILNSQECINRAKVTNGPVRNKRKTQLWAWSCNNEVGDIGKTDGDNFACFAHCSYCGDGAKDEPYEACDYAAEGEINCNSDCTIKSGVSIRKDM